MMRFEVVTDESGLTSFLEEWDALAVLCESPFAAPAWALSWWRNCRTGDARLRVVLVFDGDRLVGVGPFFAQISSRLVEIRLLAAGFSHRLGPLAVPDYEDRVAGQLALAFGTMDPRPHSLVLEGVDLRDDWAGRLAANWTGRPPHVRDDLTMNGSVAEFASFDEWFERRSSKFRTQFRRNERRLERDGVTFDASYDRRAAEDFARLHFRLWEERGGTSLDPDAVQMVVEAAAELGPRKRLQIFRLLAEDRPVAAAVVVSAGSDTAFWAMGFDRSWQSYSPGLHVTTKALLSCAEAGTRRADFGGGDDTYKMRLSDQGAPITWRTLFPRDARYPLTRMRLAPKHLRQHLRRLASRLPSDTQERLRRYLRRAT